MTICITGGMAFEVKARYDCGMAMWVHKKFALCELYLRRHAVRAVHYLDIVTCKESSSNQVVAFTSVFCRRKQDFNRK